MRLETELNEVQLAARVARGDLDAGRELFGRHAEELYRFAHHRLADRGAAEDVVQETFLAALDRIGTFDGRGSLSAWLRGIAKHRIADHFRRRPMGLSEALLDADGEIDSILARVSREELPDSALEAKETAELVDATLASLPPEYARALVAKYVEGRSTAELAAEGGRTNKAAESLLLRARRAFAEVFELLARRRGGLP